MSERRWFRQWPQLWGQAHLAEWSVAPELSIRFGGGEFGIFAHLTLGPVGVSLAWTLYGANTAPGPATTLDELLHRQWADVDLDGLEGEE